MNRAEASQRAREPRRRALAASPEKRWRRAVRRSPGLDHPVGAMIVQNTIVSQRMRLRGLRARKPNGAGALRLRVPFMMVLLPKRRPPSVAGRRSCPPLYASSSRIAARQAEGKSLLQRLSGPTLSPIMRVTKGRATSMMSMSGYRRRATPSTVASDLTSSP